jgi:predicted deacylase
MTATKVPKPDLLRVEFGEQATCLAHYRLGLQEGRVPRVLVLAGIHGREHGGIQTAYELLGRLSGLELRGRVDLLPVCNPMAYAAETRFTPDGDLDMARAFSPGEPTNLTEGLSQAVMSLAGEADVVLDLHSAGQARYWPHVIYYRPQDAEWAAELGLPFIISRRRPDQLAGRMTTRLRPEQRAATLELGGGVVAYPEDVALGLEVILALLGRMEMLGTGEFGRPPTPPEWNYTRDARQFVYAPSEGAFYSRRHPGEDVEQGEEFGFWVPLDGLHPQPMPSPITGKLIYVRIRNRVSKGATLAMFLPKQQKKEEIE